MSTSLEIAVSFTNMHFFYSFQNYVINMCTLYVLYMYTIYVPNEFSIVIKYMNLY